jgi:hypothetical protein
MGRFGFFLLLVGGALLIVKGITLALDAASAMLFVFLIDNFITPYVGIPDFGTIVVSALNWISSLGGVGVLIGALIWFGFGWGLGAQFGKWVVSLSTFSAAAFVVWHVLLAYQTGIFSLPLSAILAHFTSLGLGFAAVALVVVGTLFGAGRTKVVVKVVEKEPEKTEE